MRYEINLTSITIILIDIVMLWACWMLHRHFSLIEFEDKQQAAADTQHRQRFVHRVEDSLNTDKGEFSVVDER